MSTLFVENFQYNFFNSLSLKKNRCKDHQEAANIIRTHRLRVGAVPHELFNSLEAIYFFLLKQSWLMFISFRLYVIFVLRDNFKSFSQVWIATFPQMSLREVLYNLERLSKHGFLASKDNQLTQEVLEKLKTTEESFKFAEIYILFK
jgi:hypothetical protein